MRLQQDRAAGGLVDAARLHADEAVFHEVEAADAVLAAQLVEPGQDRRGRHRLAVDRDRVALLEGDLDISGVSGASSGSPCADRRNRAPPRRGSPAPCPRTRCAGGSRRPKTAPRRACPWRSGSGSARRIRSASCGWSGPIQPPGRDDLDVGVQRIGRQFEPDLVVALAGRAVADGIGAGLGRDLDQTLGDQRPRDGGAEQVEPLVERVGRNIGKTKSRTNSSRRSSM
jgi:hypothetical protein